MDELYLIYVHKTSPDYKGIMGYDFIFSNTIKGIDGVGWGEYPANGNPEPPNKEFIKQVGKVNVDFNFHVAQDNEQFSMWDAIDGVIPLAWEDIDGLDDYPDNRLVFPYGIKINKVKDLLYEKDMIIKYEKELKDE